MSKDNEKLTLTTHTLENLATEGTKGFEDLCKLAEELGYKRGWGDQLQCKNGSFVSSLMDFFEDNPGMIETMHDWVRDNYSTEIEENDKDLCDAGGCEDPECEKCFDDTAPADEE